MKLSADQITYLFKFCEKHLVYFYEVQVELVDHLANAIEQKMSENKKLAFNDALDKVYADFGVMGFAPIVQQKGAQVYRQVRKEYWGLVKKQFGWPKVLGFLTLTAVFYTLLSWHFMTGMILILVLTLIGTVITIYYQVSLAKYIKRSGRKFLLSGYTHAFQTGWLSFYLLCQVFTRVDFFSEHPMLVSVTGGFFMICFIVSDQLVKSLKKKLILQFPEIFTPLLAG